jgi:hypothetical protein
MGKTSKQPVTKATGSLNTSANSTYPGTSPFLSPTSTVVVSVDTATVLPEPSASDYKQGNAYISIPGIWTGEVWLTSFLTGSYTQFEQDQLHRGVSWFPIRRSEMYIQFTIDWPYQSLQRPTGFQDMQTFQDALRLHQQQSGTTTGTPQPITLVYYNGTGNNPGVSQLVSSGNLPINGNNRTLLNQVGTIQSPYSLSALTYQGWIDTVEKEYARFKSMYRRTYRMNVLNTTNDIQVSELQTTSAYSSITPNQLSATTYGFGWAEANISRGNAIITSQIPG